MVSRLLIIIIFTLGVITGCGEEAEKSPGSEESAVILKGVSLSPRTYQEEDFLEFFDKTEQTGQIVMWAGDWAEVSPEGGASGVVAQLASEYDYIPLIEASHFEQETGQLLRPLDEEMKQDYMERAVAFAGKYKPAYFGFGIEINILYEKSPGDFEEFIPFYNDVYDAIKAASPETRVFTVFQLEKMKGLSFWSTSAEPGQPEWEFIDHFKTDIIAFTTYPGLVYGDPSEIPQKYYTEIMSHTTKPVAFTEIGWHSAPHPPGWESSEAEQAEFVETFFNLTNGLEVEVAVWSFMYDQQTIDPFSSMGLRRDDGSARPAWEAWVGEGN